MDTIKGVNTEEIILNDNFHLKHKLEKLPTF